jgi:two-component system, NarL family, response regulator NreC
MTPIRILLAEDHNVVREGLRLLLNAQPGMHVIAEATTGQEAIALAKASCPDVAVLDITMPDVDGIQATAEIRRQCPETRILILTMHESDAYFFRAVEAGASGYVLKKAASEDLIGAVRAVARGEAFFYPSVARKLLDSYLGQTHGGEPSRPPGFQDLSEREREIFFLIVRGLSNQEIAEQLVISPSTVQTHRSHILEKLHVDTIVELVRYAIRHGLIEA